jgi:hypothetical protein
MVRWLPLRKSGNNKMTQELNGGLVLLALALGMAYAARAGKLTTAGIWLGGAIGLSIYWGTGFTGLGLLALFLG